MWPWGHLAVGYLCYVALLEVRDAGKQTLLTLFAVGFGSQFPDLIDKPLAWSMAVLPSGRSFAHSLITATLIIGIAYQIGRRLRREEAAIAFGVGYLSHSLVDLGPTVVFGLLKGDVSQMEWTTYLLWPLLPSPPYPNDSSFYEHFVELTLDPYMVAQFVLLGVAIAVWIATGMPGVTEVRQGVRNRLKQVV
ncbi:metal-dependent hydrolase [Halorussus salinisoli]|uniref:metal-dependent hydrolase n=1 Tax=Halorussus salinisoli TaxID=2558242 RepID=UPI0010C190C0|nr:metal-dependent hydrolase [Halorussus salinisoli]